MGQPLLQETYCHLYLGLHTYPDNVLVYHYQAAKHGKIGQHGEDGEDSETLDEDQQYHKWQQGQYVQPGVHGWSHQHCLVGIAVACGSICSRNHLRIKKKNTGYETI